MLCKTTMRAALAHVLGIVGAFAAFVGSAAEPTGASQEMSYATEALGATSPYAINATPLGTIVLDVKIDTLIEADADTNHYLVIDFGDAQLRSQVNLLTNAAGDGITAYMSPDPDGDGTRNPGDVTFPINGTAGTVADTNGENAVAPEDPALPPGEGILFYTFTASTNGDADTPSDVGTAGSIARIGVFLERAYRGDETDSTGVYQMTLPGDIAIDTHIRLELGSLLAISSTSASSYTAKVWIYEELGDARAAARGVPPANYAYESGDQALFSTASSLATAGATITGNILTADVGHQNGPFLGFEADTDSMTTANVGNLAMIMLEADDYADFLTASTGKALTSMVLTGADVEVASDVPGAFGFGVGAGHGATGEVAIEDDEATMDVDESNTGGAPTAFMISSSAACMDNPLMLSNAAGDAVDPNAAMDPVFSADATMGTASVTGLGPHYFCVLTENAAGKMNEVAIPIVPGSTARAADGYSIEVTTKAGSASGPMAMGDGGSIERNGASLNITFLSLDPLYEQRLVIVNRSNREAAFWMDDGDFQSEPGTMISSKMGTDGINGTVGPGMRMVVKVQDVLESTGELRASGTLNLTAPQANVDVMTVQVHPGTGQVDTTLY